MPTCHKTEAKGAFPCKIWPVQAIESLRVLKYFWYHHTGHLSIQTPFWCLFRTKMSTWATWATTLITQFDNHQFDNHQIYLLATWQLDAILLIFSRMWNEDTFSPTLKNSTPPYIDNSNQNLKSSQPHAVCKYPDPILHSRWVG